MNFFLAGAEMANTMEYEAGIAGRCLAFGPRKCVFLMRLWMQEHREIGADRPVAGIEHLLRRSTDHDVIAVFYRQAQQFVANAAAYCITLHAGINDGGLQRKAHRPRQIRFRVLPK